MLALQPLYTAMMTNRAPHGIKELLVIGAFSNSIIAKRNVLCSISGDFHRNHVYMSRDA